ncbi:MULTISPECIES: DUF3817 domain-containing protein [Pseudomonas syringae group]|uniref:DUF3817 domain-containing protein n=1 Tax=Pseudomonas syringae group TaxID=136849 RepID=UPI000D9F70E0|nr:MULTISPECIES: DUF3817 domain-containing protein [Pseudomonas syringae group]MBM0212898.1 DUF3817 domain-containing protein [Pseudomonas syringae pv. maculicola]PYD02710.1 hypothetical protein DND90_26615 [Pseudomonas syringae pv. maculicola]QQN24931.1 DUF3817 domain-containing protein [Pseudomonas syringae pv. maculicola]RMM09862.1 hypothetical protein ALQ85_200109 [Pseudomonas syringae]
MFKQKVGMFSTQRLLGWAALLEGSTLILLICVAVPIKYALGYPEIVSWMGPLHGLSFLIYIWLVLTVAAEDKWKTTIIVRALVAAFIPLGGLWMAHHVLQRQATGGVE